MMRMPGLVILAVTLSLVHAVAAETVPAREYGRVEILRDTWGVPHVFAETDAGAMYGLGYAAAEDRGFQMHLKSRIMQGRLHPAPLSRPAIEKLTRDRLILAGP